MHKKIVITGATGLIGRNITNELCRRGAYVKIITGNPDKARKLFSSHYVIEIFDWHRTESEAELAKIIDGSDAVINLAGVNIGSKRWTEDFKKELYESRIETTKFLVNAIQLCNERPECLLNASGAGIYGFRGDEILDEQSSFGNDFLANLCKDWEIESMKAANYNVRVVNIRTGIVLDKKEGALPALVRPFKFFAGGYHASGKQWLSWIHIDDIVSVYTCALENENLRGALNGTSPNPVTNKKLSEIIGKVLHKPAAFRFPAIALYIAAGEFAKNLIEGQRIYPEKLKNAGFEFKHPQIEEALKSLLTKSENV